VVKQGIIRKIASLRRLINQRDPDSTSSTEEKTSTEEGGDVYLASIVHMQIVMYG
jgi:hypothetical protein